MGYSIDSHIQHTFDSYCRTVIRNEARNIKKQYKRFRKHQISLTSLDEHELDVFQYVDLNSENSEIFLLSGMEILVADAQLATAISSLREDRRKIILLFYFAGFGDREIGQIIGMSTGGIWYQRQKAVEEMRAYLKENIDEK